MLDPYWPRYLAACRRQDPTLLTAMQGARQLGVGIIPNGDGGLKFDRGALSQADWDTKFVPVVRPKLDTHIKPALILAAQMPHPWLSDLKVAYDTLSESRRRGIAMHTEQPERLDVVGHLARVIYHLLVIGGVALDVTGDNGLYEELRILYRNLGLLANKYAELGNPSWMTPAPIVIDGQQVRITQDEAIEAVVSTSWLTWAMLPLMEQLQEEEPQPLRKGA